MANNQHIILRELFISFATSYISQMFWLKRHMTKLTLSGLNWLNAYKKGLTVLTLNEN